MQFVREFAKLGLTRSVGGVLGLALSRELTPVVTSIILAGMFYYTHDSLQCGACFASLGTSVVYLPPSLDAHPISTSLL